MSNNYVENENGFFVKLTLFKDDLNKAKWYMPFNENAFKQLGRSLGKIPYIDITKISKGDDHKEFETRKYIAELQEQGVPDEQIVEKVWEKFEPLSVGHIVDMYDVQKGASFGGVLNTCDLSMGMCRETPKTAIADFILKVENEDYKKGIREGKINPTPSPSIYGSYELVEGNQIYDTNEFLDFLHVANANIPANGNEARMKAYCEGSLGSCKKGMANASLLRDENINTSVTEDNPRMSETQNPTVPETNAGTENVPTGGFDAAEFAKLLENYNVPKEVQAQLTNVSETLSVLKESNETTKKELEAMKAAEQERKLNERKALIKSHINLDKHFGGKVEDFTNKVNWINEHFPKDEDLKTYLDDAFPIKIEKAETNKDNPQKGSAYGGVMFNPTDLLKEEEVSEAELPTKRVNTQWGSIIPLKISEWYK